MGIQGISFERALPRRLAIAAAIASAMLCAPVQAADHQGTAEAVILRPLTLIKTADLDFGSLISGPTAGTVTVQAATGVRTTTGGVTPVGSGAQRATFQGAAAIGLLVVMNGSSSVTLTRVGGGAAPMTASLNHIGGSGLATVSLPLIGSVTIVAAGVQTFHSGGTLTVPANQPAGSYSGTFTMTVNYL